jgi:DNA-binding response OmpR family regulator
MQSLRSSDDQSGSDHAIRSPRVLVVEDQEKCALDVMRSLREPGHASFEVDVVSNLSEALRYVERDEIDIYVVDLALPADPNSIDQEKNGKQLVRQIFAKSNAGILVHTHVPLSSAGEELYELGADDYLEKGDEPKILRSKAFALWRRIRATRPSTNSHFVHRNRVFRIREWRFVVGDRIAIDDDGKSVRLTPTEHEFLCYVCTVEGHQIDRREFNVGVLGRPIHKQDQRIDNLVYQINQKFGTCLHNVCKEDGTYKLQPVKELRSASA